MHAGIDVEAGDFSSNLWPLVRVFNNPAVLSIASVPAFSLTNDAQALEERINGNNQPSLGDGRHIG